MKAFAHPSSPRRLIVAASVAVSVGAAAVLALASSASSKPPSLGVDKSVQVGSTTESIAATPRGVAVYALFPETAKHLLCRSSKCLSFWPAVKVATGAQPTKGAGLKGTLGTLKRTGFTQLTLNGHPLYTFAEDKGKTGEAHGDRLKGFGGTWHVFREAGAAPSKATSGPATPSTTTSASSNPYGY